MNYDWIISHITKKFGWFVSFYIGGYTMKCGKIKIYDLYWAMLGAKALFSLFGWCSQSLLHFINPKMNELELWFQKRVKVDESARWWAQGVFQWAGPELTHYRKSWPVLSSISWFHPSFHTVVYQCAHPSLCLPRFISSIHSSSLETDALI